MLSLTPSHVSTPIVQVLTMGGTIAGVAQSATAASYQSGAKSGAELLDAVSGLPTSACLRVQDIVGKDSSDLVFEDWWTLQRAVRDSISDEGVSGIVITHGTDTLEETAYFLSLLVDTQKPIVVVGAMRPATALSADGPLNLFNAVAVAVNSDSVGRGVLVVMNDRIFQATHVTKSHSTAVDAFMAPDSGAIGSVILGCVKYLQPVPTRIVDRLSLSDATLASLSELPRVDVLYLHAAMTVPQIEVDTVSPKLRGLVLAGMGAGNIPTYLKGYIDALRLNGVVVVRATRVWAGGVIADYQQLDSQLGLVSAGRLNAHKAKILLMLALLETSDLETIQNYFDAV